ncbi:MAG: AtpZ/AtpI family protein [Anaerolineales bacterium]
MVEDDKRQKQAQAFATANLKLTAVAGQVGCLTLLIVFVALFLGIYLDRLLGTKPVFLIMLVLGSAPISLFLTYKIALNAAKKANAPIMKKESNDQQKERGDLNG